MSTETRHPPLPRPSATSRPFWDACRRHQLVVQRCDTCGRFTFIPQTFCRHCLSRDLTWVPSSGRGRVYSYTVVWRPQTPAFPVPYVVAIIEMDEGYQMLSNVVGCPAEAVSIGMPVEVIFEDVSRNISLPKFRPATPAP